MKHQNRLITASLSALFLLVGCQSKEAYFAKLDSWKGQPESALLAKRGAPNRFFESNGIRYLTYNYSSNYQTPVNCSGGGVANSSVLCTGGQNVNFYCEETFYIKQGVIQNIRYKGNNCY